MARLSMLVLCLLPSLALAGGCDRMLRQFPLDVSAEPEPSDGTLGTQLAMVARSAKELPCLQPNAGAAAFNSVGALLGSFLGSVPYAGSALKGITAFLWPNEKVTGDLTADCVWNSIKGYVEEYVQKFVIQIYEHEQQLIIQERLRSLDLLMKSFTPTIASYNNAGDDYALRAQMWGDLNGVIERAEIYVFDDSLAPVSAISYQIAYGTLTLSWLADDVYRYGLQHDNRTNLRPKQTYQEFQDKIAFFRGVVSDAKLKLIDSVLLELLAPLSEAFPSGYQQGDGGLGCWFLQSKVPGFAFRFGIPYKTTGGSCVVRDGPQVPAWRHTTELSSMSARYRDFFEPESAYLIATAYQRSFMSSIYQWRKLKYDVLANPATAWKAMDVGANQAVETAYTNETIFAGGAGTFALTTVNLLPPAWAEGKPSVWNISRIIMGYTRFSTETYQYSPTSWAGYPPHDPSIHFMQFGWKRADGTGSEVMSPVAGNNASGHVSPELAETKVATLKLAAGEYITRINGQFSWQYTNFLFMGTNLGRNISAGEIVQNTNDNSVYTYEWAQEAGAIHFAGAMVEVSTEKTNHDWFGFVANLNLVFDVRLLKNVKRDAA